MSKDISSELTDKGWNLDWDLDRNKRNKWKNFWNRIRWRAKDIYWEIRNFPQFIKRVWDYLPILYKDRDYDYISILTLLAYKCKRTREYIETHGHLMNSDRTCNQLRFAEFLIERIIKDEYCSKEIEEIDKKYGSITLLSRNIDEEGKEIIAAREVLFTRKNCLEDPKLIKKEKEEINYIWDKAEKLKQDDYDMLFKHIRKHIQTWWD